VLLLGAALGGAVGVGTLAFAVGLGPSTQTGLGVLVRAGLAVPARGVRA
jgi:uncharacterized membrane protein YczE